MLCPGDMLFALGCGRLVEDNLGQIWAPLSRTLHLPQFATVSYGTTL